MKGVYTTKAGDVWDKIAKDVYGKESAVSFLMANNQEYLGYFVFPEGVRLTVKDLPESKGRLPDWRN